MRKQPLLTWLSLVVLLGTVYMPTSAAAEEFRPSPALHASWYFAEGSTQSPFDTWFLVQNPTDKPAKVRFTFQLQPSGTVTREVTVAPTSRYSLFANEALPAAAFSTRIDADQAVLAERAVYVGYDGTIVTGIRSPSRTWLFAEGSTQSPFHTWLLLQNPGDAQAMANVTYLLDHGNTIAQSVSLTPNSRTSILVNSVVPNAAFSTRVDSDQPIVAERAMYRFPGNAAAAVSGVNAPSRTWYFADGNTTQSPIPFDTWLLLQNPNPAPVPVNIALLDSNGAKTTLSLTLPPTSRQSVFLNQIMPDASFGIVVTTDRDPIVVEKALYFGIEPRGAAATQGATEPSTTWYLAEGSTASPFTEYISILNPNAEPISVHLDFDLPNGQVVGRELSVEKERKLTVNVNDILPNTAVSARITTSLPTVVERTMLFGKPGSLGGHNTIGIQLPKLVIHPTE